MLTGILRLRSTANSQLLHYPRVSVHNDQLTAAFVNTVKPASGVKTLGGGRHGYGFALTVRPSGVKYRYRHLYINRDATQPGGRLVLGAFKVAERERLHTIPCSIRDAVRPLSLTATQ